MLDKVIGILLIISPFFIFIGKQTDLVVFTLIFLLSIKILISKNNLMKIIFIGIILIGIYNFKLSMEYFNYGYSFLDKQGTIQYLIRLIGIIAILYVFSLDKYVEKIYLSINKWKKLLLIEVIISQLYLIYMVISGKGFLDRWGLKTFVGASYSPHIYGYTLIVMVIIIELLFILYKRNIILLLYIFPLSTSLITGARTPAVAMILVFIGIRFFRNKKINTNNNNNIKIKNLLLFILISIFIILFINNIIEYITNSNLFEKFIQTSQSGNFMNGRGVYWKNSIETFAKSSFANKILGCGIYYTVLVNKITTTHEIWAHSDIFDILISFGLLTLIIYIYMYIRYFSRLLKYAENKIMIYLIIIAIILLIMTNGFVNYTVIIPVLCYISLLKKTYVN